METMVSKHRIRWEALAAVLAIAGTAIVLAAVLAFVWYPTTLQPEHRPIRRRIHHHGLRPLGTGRFANRYDWTFTLTNSGQADGLASVGFGLDGQSHGFRSYDVPRGSRIQATGLSIGEVHSEASACTGPENPTISLASFSRIPPVDNQDVIIILGGGASTATFSGLLLGVLAIALRRRGQSLLSNWWGLPAVVLAFLLLTAAGLFSNVVMAVVQSASNAPGVGWSLALVYGIPYTLIGLLIVYLAFRLAFQHAPGRPPSLTGPGG